MDEVPQTTETVLAVLPSIEDQVLVRQVFSFSRWEVRFAGSFQQAATTLQEVGVVISDDHLPDRYEWKDLLYRTWSQTLPQPFIVTSRTADDLLWGKVISLGGFDVLAKPLRPNELFRVVASAWSFWKEQRFSPRRRGKAVRGIEE